jgi:hypothetical protein
MRDFMELAFFRGKAQRRCGRLLGSRKVRGEIRSTTALLVPMHRLKLTKDAVRGVDAKRPGNRLIARSISRSIRFDLTYLGAYFYGQIKR